MSAKRRRKCAVAATLGVSGVMDESVMKLLSQGAPIAGALCRDENEWTIEATQGRSGGLMVGSLTGGPESRPVVQIGGGENRARALDRPDFPKPGRCSDRAVGSASVEL